jgi:transposase
MSVSKLFVGCDVSKGYADFIILDQEKNILERCFRLDDTGQGHTVLRNILTQYSVSHPDATMYVGIESTGGFENNWLSAFEQMSKELPVKSARINPCPIKKFLDAEAKRTRTDEVSAWGIAAYMIAHFEKIIFNQDDPFYSSRRQWNTLQLFHKQQVQLLNQLHAYLYSANPGVLIYCRNGIPAWLLSVLHRWPTSALLSKAKVSAVSKIPFLSIIKAQALINNAKKDVASHTDQCTEFMIRQIIDQIKSTKNAVNNIEKAFCKEWREQEQVKLLTSIPGVGTLSALGLLINIRDYKLFEDASHLASYFGLNPVFKQSGDGLWGYRMSKQGRAQPRAILFMVTLSAIVHNPLIRELYHKSLKKSHKRMSAVGICMHKMIRIVYGMLKTNKPFDPETDKKNQHKSQDQNAKQKKNQESRSRRFQSADSNAPISGRHAKKRTGKGSQVALPQNAGSPDPVT